MDFTGCGNTFKMREPRCCSSSWTASATGSRRCTSTASASIWPAPGPRAVRSRSLGAFFDIIHQDPILSQVKLIAEPWDLGTADTRSAISPRCGASGTAAIATVSGDFGRRRRPRTRAGHAALRLGRPVRVEQPPTLPSVNFITCHDGFTLHDLVSYNDKHNEPTAKGAATDRTTTSAGTAASKDRPTTPKCWRSAIAEAKFPGDAVPLAGRAHAAGGDEMGNTQQATTMLTVTIRTDVAQLEARRAATRAAAYTQSVIALRKINPVFQRQSFPRSLDPRHRRARHQVVRPTARK